MLTSAGQFVKDCIMAASATLSPRSKPGQVTVSENVKGKVPGMVQDSSESAGVKEENVDVSESCKETENDDQPAKNAVEGRRLRLRRAAAATKKSYAEESKPKQRKAGQVAFVEKKPKKANVKVASAEEDADAPQDPDESSYEVIDEDPIPAEDAKGCWPYRFTGNGWCPKEEDQPPRAVAHHRRVRMDDIIISLGDTVYVKAPEGIEDFLGMVMEIFTTKNKNCFVRLRWFFRSYDTILESFGPKYLDKKQIWWSEETNTNPISCITGSVNIARVPIACDSAKIPECDFYYQRGYAFKTTAFFDIPDDADAPYPDQAHARIGKIPSEYKLVVPEVEVTSSREQSPDNPDGKGLPLLVSDDEDHSTDTPAQSGPQAEAAVEAKAAIKEDVVPKLVKLPKQEAVLTVLDLYAGCGGMSTGLEMGGPLAGCTLVSKWAVDFNAAACVSMKYNHPETQVRNESAGTFLTMLKEWSKLCEKYSTAGQKPLGRSGRAMAHRHKKEEKGKEALEVEEASEEEAMANEDEAAAVEALEAEMQQRTMQGQGKGKKRAAAEVYKKSSRSAKRQPAKARKTESNSDAKGRSGVKKAESEKPSQRKKKGEEYDEGEFEVEKIVNVRWVETEEYKGLQYLVRWKSFGEEDDTWEPASGLQGCDELIGTFVMQGQKDKILPLPGDVSLVCGGPPCQGASGFNRFRNHTDPLSCPRNSQLIVFMDIVEWLSPKFILMENVVDMMKFEDAILSKYAIGRMVALNYQSRTGLLVAGCFGVAQYRMRAFFFGAQAGEVLPIFPLPTHFVAATRGSAPVKWQRNLVAWDEDTDLNKKLRPALTLGDCITDLPPVENHPGLDEMPYTEKPKTAFQMRMRLPKTTFATGEIAKALKSHPELLESKLYDHLPLKLKDDDLYRTKQIPKQKGANFRDLKGVLTFPDKTCGLDPTIERPMIPGRDKPLCPDYAISFMKGMSFKPFARLWWDQTVPTVITRAEPHNHQILHPHQDRVLTVRENARLQGFPDHYKLFGTVKERYCQVGNAVSVPIAQALGYALGLAALKKISPRQPTFALPEGFPFHNPEVTPVIFD